MPDTVTETLAKFESEHRSGATSIEIMAVLAQVGVKVSEATLRKYIQQGLLPRSRRVGTKGRHQGSWGIYPAWTARQIVEIKKLLAEGRSMQEISEGRVAIFSKCMEAAAALKEVERKLEKLAERKNVDSLGIGKVRELVAGASGLVEKAAEKALGSADIVEIAI
jgi:phage gp16-like protein